ncbi:MAG: D-allose-binding periplasmic protein [Anaerolineae bacterium]|nr:D-allose-binding periplasmic protein [Anaerolineae bacterium]
MKLRFLCYTGCGLLLAVGLFSGCGAGPPTASAPLIVQETVTPGLAPTPAPANARYQIALVMKTLTNPFFVEMEKGARKAEKELGIDLIVKTGAQETSIEQQISIIKNFLEEDIDAIVIAPADSKELIPVLKEAQNAGIVIINIDNQLNPLISKELGLTGVPYISVDNEHGAYLSAQYISRQITTPTNVVILEGIRSAKNAQDRKAGAMRAFEENANIQLVAAETANWKIDEAYQVTGSLFEQYPDIGAIFAANDMMAFGAIRYLAETGHNNVLVAAYDALAEAKEAIRNGQLQSTIDQQAALQGYTGVQFAVRALEGETLPAETILDVKLVTGENVD